MKKYEILIFLFLPNPPRCLPENIKRQSFGENA